MRVSRPVLVEGGRPRDPARPDRQPADWPFGTSRVLTYGRSRLRASASPERIFDTVRSVIDQTGVLAGKRRRALDSTLLDDAVATQDTVTQLVSTIRRVRRLVPEAAGVTVAAHDYDDRGSRCAPGTIPMRRQRWCRGW